MTPEMERRALLERSALLRLRLRRQVGHLRERFRWRSPAAVPTVARWALTLGLAVAGRAGGARLGRLARGAAIAAGLVGTLLALRRPRVRHRTDGLPSRR